MKRVNIFLIVLTFAVGLLFYSRLPAQMPMHWNIRGEIDNYMPKEQAAWWLPVMMVIMWVVFQVLPKFDPKKDKYHLFRHEYEIIQTGIIGFFAYLYGIIIYASMNPGLDITPFLFVGLGMLFILMGNYMSKIRQNYFLGIKTPWTLSSEANWNKTHRFASWCFVGAGILTMAEAVFYWQAPVVIFASIVLAAFLPMLYSLLLFKGKEKAMKWVYAGLAIIIVGLLLVKGISGEDDWICRNGEWIRHGNPSAAMPIGNCTK
jgi:uncharacterized membrane protein